MPISHEAFQPANVAPPVSPQHRCVQADQPGDVRSFCLQAERFPSSLQGAATLHGETLAEVDLIVRIPRPVFSPDSESPVTRPLLSPQVCRHVVFRDLRLNLLDLRV